MTSRKTFHLSEIESYGYCASRYYFEYKRNRGTDAKVTFDIKRRMFREFFRVQEMQKKNYSRLDKYVRDYQNMLVGPTAGLSPELTAAYLQKSYEALWATFKDKDVSVLTPKTMYLEFDKEFIAGIDIDAIFIERKSRKKINQRAKLTSKNAYTNIYFCVLVPPEEWHSINLSNRFDGMLCKEYIYPDLKVAGRKSTMHMLYFCPENGRSFTIDNKYIKWTSQDKSRMTDIMERMKAKKFHREPTHAKCSECPMLQDCKPRNVQEKQHRECHSIVLPTLLRG